MHIKTLLLAAAPFVAGALGALPSAAAILEYTYTGAQAECLDKYLCRLGTFSPGLTGSITLDESFLPGGSVANSTLRMEIKPKFPNGNTPGLDPYVMRYDFTTSGTTTSVEEDLSPSFQFVFPFVVARTGIIADMLEAPTVYDNALTLTFDENRNIVASGGHETTGGSGDLSHSLLFGDRSNGFFSGPGNWTLNSVTGPLSEPLDAAVPLPSGIWLMLAGLGALLGYRRSERAA